MTWHQDPSSMTNPGPSRKDLRRKRANYCRKSVMVHSACLVTPGSEKEYGE